eukprot:711847-Amphidinium_carterae.1
MDLPDCRVLLVADLVHKLLLISGGVYHKRRPQLVRLAVTLQFTFQPWDVDGGRFQPCEGGVVIILVVLHQDEGC